MPELCKKYGVLQEVCTFLRKSAPNPVLLKEKLGDLCSRVHKQRLHSSCKTRSVERHEAMRTFVELLNTIVSALETVQDGGPRNAFARAHQLLTCVLTATFIVSVHITPKYSL